MASRLFFQARAWAEEEGEKAFGQTVLIKPNCVSARRQLASTHADTVQAVLKILSQLRPKNPSSERAQMGREIRSRVYCTRLGLGSLEEKEWQVVGDPLEADTTATGSSGKGILGTLSASKI